MICMLSSTCDHLRVIAHWSSSIDHRMYFIIIIYWLLSAKYHLCISICASSSAFYHSSILICMSSSTNHRLCAIICQSSSVCHHLSIIIYVWLPVDHHVVLILRFGVDSSSPEQANPFFRPFFCWPASFLVSFSVFQFFERRWAKSAQHWQPKQAMLHITNVP